MSDDDTPAEAFDRYLAETERSLPPRYRTPGYGARARPLDPWRVAPVGIAIVGIGLLVGWWLGFPKS